MSDYIMSVHNQDGGDKIARGFEDAIDAFTLFALVPFGA